MTLDISKLQLHELEGLQSCIKTQIYKLEYQAWKAKKHTKEEIVAMFTRFGYTVPKGVKIWRVYPSGEKKQGGYGMEVGKYEHSCHIDTTDLIVLLFVGGNDHYVESFSEAWLSDSIIV